MAFSLIKKTGHVHVRRPGWSIPAAACSEKIEINHVAVLVQHPHGNFLFDSGLGRNIESA